MADTGSVILKLKWISSNRVLAVFDTYAAIINVSDGTESARYDYGGATLQSVSIGGRSTALLLAVRGGDTLVTLVIRSTSWRALPPGRPKRQQYRNGGLSADSDRRGKLWL